MIIEAAMLGRMTTTDPDTADDASGPAGGTEPSDAVASPRVRRLEWGLMEIEGLAPGKDFVLYPGGGHLWNWATHGTRHSPGIQPGDVRELLERGAAVVVLGLGMEERLGIAPPTLELLRQAGVEVHMKETRAAAALYNTLAAAGRPVGGLFHSTC
ncbi:MTH938/NDUFAF3 family protein [Streptomyces erythrochromogenes]|uniref:MTH938/NDUFAF3 family protein n=1 Tax=Streptomyces erythrochromogenes TaxID=285574 RepID=A0ABZ1QK23_9ACTN|nr:MTH938/NDUFAF3 family protein [Streptomyces erythrochromogenes]MCX5588493.1 MTH938/NDUFAF3 family protein [Streptomyces erythrochromogenes]